MLRSWASCPVAVVGLGAVLPGAEGVEAFWRNLRAGVDSVDMPPGWRGDLFPFLDPTGRDPDRTYTLLGGYVQEEDVEKRAAALAPDHDLALDRAQAMALLAAREALDGCDARAAPERTAVALGNAMGGTRRADHTLGVNLREFSARLEAMPLWAALPAEDRERVRRRVAAIAAPMPEWSLLAESGASFAASLGDLVGCRGPRVAVDAACASTLAALDAGCAMLRAHEADLVLVGGADASMEPGTFAKFCRLGALSRTGSRPFDAAADGFVMGEGAVALLLMRLEDAHRRRLPVRAVVRGVGSSSDGRGGVTAPNPRAQALAIRRAHEAAGLPPRGIAMLEAHGTGTPVGDAAEALALEEAFRGLRPGEVPMGSVKSQVGHLKSAAGGAGLLKAILAMERGVVPPSLHVETPNPRLAWDALPFRVATRAEPWRGERRAGVSAFGFGGVNYHVVLTS